MKNATLAEISSTEPAPVIKMTSQQTELDHPMPVRAMMGWSSSVTTVGPLCTKNCAPDNGIATPVHPYPAVLSVSRPKPVSRNPASHIPV